MASSKTEIAQLALSNIHNETTVEDIDTENTTLAATCRLWYDTARKAALTDFDWSFARKRLTLASHNESPPDEWSYRYQYPADCLATRRIPNPVDRNGPPTPFEVATAPDGTRSILTDLDDAVLVYTWDVEDTLLFSPAFDLALAYKLALYLAGPLTAKASLKKDLAVAYRTSIIMAAAQDANQQMDRPPPDASWIQGR